MPPAETDSPRHHGEGGPQATQGLRQGSGDPWWLRPSHAQPRQALFGGELGLSRHRGLLRLATCGPSLGDSTAGKHKAQTNIPVVGALELPYFLGTYFWSRKIDQAAVTPGEGQRAELRRQLCLSKEGPPRKEKATDLAAPNSSSETAWFPQQRTTENTLGNYPPCLSATCRVPTQGRRDHGADVHGRGGSRCPSSESRLDDKRPSLQRLLPSSCLNSGLTINTAGSWALRTDRRPCGTPLRKKTDRPKPENIRPSLEMWLSASLPCPVQGPPSSPCSQRSVNTLRGPEGTTTMLLPPSTSHQLCPAV